MEKLAAIKIYSIDNVVTIVFDNGRIHSNIIQLTKLNVNNNINDECEFST